MNRFGTRAAMLALVVATAGPATADTIVINNGLAPPNPANVIDASNSFPYDLVLVENVGCDATVLYPCPIPWGDPTSVEVVDGGYAFDLGVDESSSVVISGGSVGTLDASGSSSVRMNGGEIAGRLDARFSSSVTMSGGSVGDLLAWGSATVTLAGGDVTRDLSALFSSSVTMSGGSVGSLGAADSSRVTMSGGSVGTYIGASGSGTVTIIGTGFAVDGVPVTLGPIAAMSGTLTGTLASGEPLDNTFCHLGGSCFPGSSPATGLITLVPEPDAALLSCVAPLALAVQRRMRAAR